MIKRRLKTSKTLNILGASLLAASTLTALPSSSAEAVSSQRVGGSDRYETSSLISKRAFPDGAKVVYLARGELLADALSGSSLSDGPVLLTSSVTSKAVLDEVERLNPSQVIALGGKSVISDSLLSKYAGGRSTGRLAGADRYGTAAKISQRAYPKGSANAYVANGVVFADAVSGGSLKNGPLLPVPAKGKLPAVITAEMKRLKPAQITALGDSGALSNTTLTTLKTAAGTAPKTSRLGGADRYVTSSLIAARSYPITAETVYVTNGKVFADAVSAGSFSDGPILLVDDKADMMPILNYVKKVKPANIVALGGRSVVSETMLGRVEAAANGVITVPTQPTPQKPPTTNLPAGWSQFEYDVLTLTNRERAKVGLKALKPQTCLRGIAVDWSKYLYKNNKFEHGDFGERIDKCYNNSWSGENIIKGYDTPAEAVEGWMNSPGHKANILNGNFEYLGVGKYGNIVTQDFSSSNVQ